MRLGYLKALVAATALGAGALALSTPADAYYRGCGWRHHTCYRGCAAPVVASDYGYVAPRRSCYSGCAAPVTVG
ncbi:MAG TPA: hypothetical protein VMJ31_11915, partial [Methylocystis sp.]|nr:hypothetical protein [Methylocystis sp.]